jgi:hypothetical protein
MSLQRFGELFVDEVIVETKAVDHATTIVQEASRLHGRAPKRTVLYRLQNVDSIGQ